MDKHNYSSEDYNRYEGRNPGGRIFFGIGIALLGLLALLKAMGMLPFSLHVTWPLILIIIGVLMAFKNGFRNNAWWILILIGVAHLIPSFEINGHSSRKLFWPAAVVVAGLMIAFRPRKKKCRPITSINSQLTSDSRLVVDVAFGGSKEIITSKDFKGGTISVSFGGSEINMSQADFVGESIVLDCRITCGGVELVIPSHWEVRNEIRMALSGVEDERVIHTGTTGEPRKILILQGNCTFGGVEIKSY